MISSAEKASISIALDKSTKVNSKRAKNRARVTTSTKAVLYMTENGIKIAKMGSEYTLTIMEKNMKVIGLTARKMARELISTKTEINISETG